MRRAAKLWTRRIEGLRSPGGDHQSFPHVEPGVDGRIELDFIVGYENCGACSNHFGDPRLRPSNRANDGDNPVISVASRFLTEEWARDGQLAIGAFRVLAHEFGHIVDHRDPESDDYRSNHHSDCSGGPSIMCEGWGDDVPAVPSERDFDAIRHHYEMRSHVDHEQFGIWAEVPGGDSNLKSFGVQVTRTLTVEDATDIWDAPVADFIRDQVLIETMVRGTASSGPQPGIGTAT